MLKMNLLPSKKKIITLFIFFLFTCLYIISPYTNSSENLTIKSDNNLISENEIGSVTVSEEYFNDWFYPYGKNLPADVIEQIREGIAKMPSELSSAENEEWRCIGPYGIKHGVESYYSGRILSVEQAVSPDYELRVGSSTGGLWELENKRWVPLSDNVDNINCLTISAFATKPDDKNTIFIGTGDYKDFPGSGLFKTTDMGKSWVNVNVEPIPSYFSKIKFSISEHKIIHISSDSGYYRSDDGGTTWIRKLAGKVADMAVAPGNKILFIGLFGDGLYKSTNCGNEWKKLTSGGIPESNIGRISISICNSNPKIIYTSITTNNKSNPAGDTLLGIYKSTDGGESWNNVRPNIKYIPWTGNYFNEIAVNPQNPNIVIAAGIEMVRTIDGGKSWMKVNSNDVHMDHKSLEWSADGKTFWNGNDGGLSISKDEGATWSTIENVLPITQFYYFDIGDNNHDVIAGGLQDNGFTVTTDGGRLWEFKLGGDGGGASIDPNNAENILGAIYTDISVSSDYGVKFKLYNKGKEDCKGNPRLSPIRNDRGNPVTFYTACSKSIYFTKNLNANWEKVNGAEFTQVVNNIKVTPYSSSNPSVIYVCFQGHPKPDPENKLKVYDGGQWYERSSGLPAVAEVRTIGLPYTGNNTAFALMNGLNTPGEKIFKTTNKGINWENITGDLPDIIAAGDLFPDPSDLNRLYLGTAFGFFRSTNGGINWERWNNGMPYSLMISELKYIDSTAHNGKFYLAAATYGRGIWIRNISEIESKNVPEEKEKPKTKQNKKK